MGDDKEMRACVRIVSVRKEDIPGCLSHSG